MARTCLVYGKTNTFKSSQAAQFARWLYNRYKKPVGLLSSDSGWVPMRPEIEEGIIVPWSLSAVEHPIAVVKKVSNGFWTSSLDPRTGIGDQEKLVEISKLKTPLCGLIIEGLTSNATLFMEDSELKGRAIGQPLQGTEWNDALKKTVYKYVELGEKIVMRSQGTYGHAQIITQTYVNCFKALALPWIMFTAHETKGEDDNDKPILGPAVCGKAGVDKITGWFEVSLRAVSETYQTDIEEDGRMTKVNRNGAVLWYTNHPDQTYRNMLWPAKISVPPKDYAKVLKRWPHGHLWMVVDEETGEYTQSVATLLEMVDPTPGGIA